MRTHGLAGTYNSGCRCDECRTAHRERQRREGTNRRVGARAEQKRAWDLANRATCECGQPMAPQADRCNECRRSDEARYRRLVEDMWAEGMTGRQIADALGWHARTPTAVIANMRARGYNLPHRRTREQIARITGGSGERLARARAIYAAQREATR